MPGGVSLGTDESTDVLGHFGMPRIVGIQEADLIVHDESSQCRMGPPHPQHYYALTILRKPSWERRLRA